MGVISAALFILSLAAVLVFITILLAFVSALAFMKFMDWWIGGQR